MKLKKIFIVSIFLLAIIAMGAVSASEDITDNNVTAIEPTDEVVTESVDIEPTEQIITETVEDEATEEMISQSVEDEPTEVAINQAVEEVKIGESGDTEKISTNQRNPIDARISWYTTSKSSLKNDLIIIDSLGKSDGTLNANGTINVFVNNTKKATYALNNGKFNKSQTLKISPNDLGIKNYGTYKIKVTFLDNDSKIEETLNETTISIMIAKIDESFSFMGINEVLTIYIKIPNAKSGKVKIKEYKTDKNGTEKIILLGSAKIKNGIASFEIPKDNSTKARYLLFEYSTNIGTGNKTQYIYTEKNVGKYSVSVPKKIEFGNKAIIKFNTSKKGELIITVDGKVMRYANVSSKTRKIANLAIGKHIVRIMYCIFAPYDDVSEDPKFKAIYIKSFKVTVTKASTKFVAKKKTFKAKTKTKKYTITLKTKAGKIIKKAKVSLRVGKKTYKAKTNNKGKATFKITKLKKKGKYTATIKFAGTKTYKASKKKIKITVKK